MLIRYGLIHILAFLAALPVFVASVRAGYKLELSIASHKFGGRIFGKLLQAFGIGSLVLVPILIFACGTIVRVVDDGKNEELTWRRYIMFGNHATATKEEGGRIEIVNEPGEITVNATKNIIRMVPVQYGGFNHGDLPSPVVLEPAQMKAFRNYPIFLGPPPSSISAPSQTLSHRAIYVIRQK